MTRKTRAMILCAGFGTRMKEFTESRPKPLLPLSGKPLLEHTIRHLVSQGIRELAINVHYKAEMITEYFGDGKPLGAEITYCHEDAPSGTAGGVKKMEAFLSSADEFLVLYGDILTNQDFRGLIEAHRAQRALGSLILHQRIRSNSIVEMDAHGRITRFLERPDVEQMEAYLKKRPAQCPSWVNSGLYCLSREVFRLIPAEQVSDFPKDIFPKLLEQESLFGHPLKGYRCAIDTPQRYEEAQSALAGQKIFPWLRES